MVGTFEKLLVLADHGKGLCARLRNMQDFKTPEEVTNNHELEKFFKLLTKKFPEFPPQSTHTLAYQVIETDAVILEGKLHAWYLTLLDVLEWKDEAWMLIVQLASTTTSLKIEVNPDMCYMFFNLYCRYFEISVLLGRIPDIKPLSMLYAKAKEMKDKQPEAAFVRLAEFLSTPFLQRFQAQCLECKTLVELLEKTVEGFQQHILNYNSHETIMSKRLFNIVEDPKNMGIPSQIEEFQIIACMEDVKRWTLLSAILTPAILANPSILTLVLLVAKEYGFALPVFRDQHIEPHAEFDHLIGNFKVPDKKFKMSKHKKEFKEAAAYEMALATHDKARAFWRVMCGSANAFFLEFPAFIAPKMQLIAALLTCARNEVLWYYRHLNALPHKVAKNKMVWIEDDQISTLIHHVRTLYNLVFSQHAEIKQYYMALIKSVDIAAFQAEAQTFRANCPNAVGVDLEGSFLGGLQQARNSSLESCRMDWKRMVYSLSTDRSAIPLRITNYFKIGSKLHFHCKLIDQIHDVMRVCGSFALLFPYRNDLKETLDHMLVLAQGQPGHGISLTQTMQDAIQLVHRVCPEEQMTIGKAAVQTADLFLRTIVSQVIKLIKKVMSQNSILDKRASAEGVIQEMMGRIKASQRPGYESTRAHMNKQRNSALFRKAISEICVSFNACEEIVVFKHRLVPREFLIAIVEINVQKTLQNLLEKPVANTTANNLTMSSDGPCLEEPIRYLDQIKQVIISYQGVEEVMNLDVASIIKRSMLLNNTIPGVGGPGEQLWGHEEKTPEKKTSAETVAKWYCKWFDQDLGRCGVHFSNDLQRFIYKKEHNRTSQVFDAQLYTSQEALQALCTIIGPAGVRCVEKTILKATTVRVLKLKKILQNAAPELQKLGSNYSDMARWNSAVKNLNGFQALDDAASHLSIIGCQFKLIELMRKALGKLTKRNFPDLLSAVSALHKHAHRGTNQDEELGSLDHMASDMGILTPEQPHNLMISLAECKSSASDKTWDNLTNLAALMFAAPSISGVRYLIETDGHTNSASCMTDAIIALVVCFQRTMPSEENVELAIQDRLELFVQQSAYSILHMHSTDVNSVVHLMSFLDLIVKSSNGRLKLSMLESVFPYTMLRTNYIYHFQMGEKHGLISSDYIEDEVKEDTV